MTALALGAQSAALEVALIVLFPIVLFQAAEGSDAVAAWAVLAMLTANGATTILQAFRAGPLGLRPVCDQLSFAHKPYRSASSRWKREEQGR